jgi:hypothetical protein
LVTYLMLLFGVQISRRLFHNVCTFYIGHVGGENGVYRRAE